MNGAIKLHYTTHLWTARHNVNLTYQNQKGEWERDLLSWVQECFEHLLIQYL